MTARRLVPVLLAALLLAAPAAAAARGGTPTPGADGIGDRLFPQLGNGGYDAKHYDLAVTYPSSAPEQDVSGKVTMLARSTQSLSSFDLDFAGDSVASVRVNRHAADFERRRRGAGDHAAAADQARRQVHGVGALRLGALHAGARRRPAVWLVHDRRRLRDRRPAGPVAHDLSRSTTTRPTRRATRSASTCPEGVDGGRQRRAALDVHARRADALDLRDEASRWRPS